ncbi:unnamed protein product, partial [Protopolystoma xenopodis]
MPVLPPGGFGALFSHSTRPQTCRSAQPCWSGPLCYAMDPVSPTPNTGTNDSGIYETPVLPPSVDRWNTSGLLTRLYRRPTPLTGSLYDDDGDDDDDLTTGSAPLVAVPLSPRLNLTDAVTLAAMRVGAARDPAHLMRMDDLISAHVASGATVRCTCTDRLSSPPCPVCSSGLPGASETQANRDFLVVQMSDEIQEIIRGLQLTSNDDSAEWFDDGLAAMRAAKTTLDSRLQFAN